MVVEKDMFIQQELALCFKYASGDNVSTPEFNGRRANSLHFFGAI
jgi:hypothetical protein